VEHHLPAAPLSAISHQLSATEASHGGVIVKMLKAES